MTKMRIGVFAAAVMSTSLLAAVPAQADNSSEFLDTVSAEGINVGETPEDVTLTLSAGEHVCHLLNDGSTTEQARRDAHYALPHASSQQLTSFVDAAQSKLCAQAFAPLPANGGW